MSAILGDDDRRAVDLLIQQRSESSPSPAVVQSPDGPASAPLSFDPLDHETGFGSTSSASVGERLKVVEKIFEVLDVLPAIDPPADLVARTLNFISQATPPPRLERSSTIAASSGQPLA